MLSGSAFSPAARARNNLPAASHATLVKSRESWPARRHNSGEVAQIMKRRPDNSGEVARILPGGVTKANETCRSWR
jgi:hypothetical protein